MASSRHLERMTCPFELSTRYSDKLFDPIRKRYKELAKEKNVFRLMAFIYLRHNYRAEEKEPEGKQAIKDGKIYADPIQFPRRMGSLAVQQMMRYFDGEVPPKHIPIATSLYRKADADADPDLK